MLYKLNTVFLCVALTLTALWQRPAITHIDVARINVATEMFSDKKPADVIWFVAECAYGAHHLTSGKKPANKYVYYLVVVS